MKRKWLAVLCLLAVAALLTSCGSQNESSNQSFTEVTQYLGPTATATPEATAVPSSSSVFSNNPYVVSSDSSIDTTDADAIAAQAMEEESYQDSDTADTAVDSTADATVYPYAGSSPIPLIPVDAPTATPRPTLTFSYITYTASALGLTFEGPAGWVEDASTDGVYTLTEPEAQIKDNQLGILTITVSPVTSNYTQSELEKEIESRLDTISATNFVEWKPSYTATRYLMGSKGVYANYSGTMADGTVVGGRLHAVTLDSTLYCIEITYPYAYKDDYLNVFSQLRETIARVSTGS